MTPPVEAVTSEQVRERLEADVLMLAAACGDRIFSQARFVQPFSSETLERLRLAFLGECADAYI